MKYILYNRNVYKCFLSMFSMVEQNDWTYIRIRQTTGKKLKILKAEMEAEMYDDVLDVLLSEHKYKKEDKRK